MYKSRRKRSLALGVRRRPLVEAQIGVIDAQWVTLVARLRESGQLDNCIAICDVSGSMRSINDTTTNRSPFNVDPIWPAISLSPLVARLAKPPFNDSFITFSLNPHFVAIDSESSHVSLGATIEGMRKAEWRMNTTDFNAVFLRLILPLAIKHGAPKDQMIKRVFVFSDMQFDAARSDISELTIGPDGWPRVSTHSDPAGEWKTNHDVIAEAYAQAGYEVPEIVYWDLSNPRNGHGITTPVTGEREGVALLSGYSPSLLKLFMGVEDESEITDKEDRRAPTKTPEALMKKSLGISSYDGLVVVD